MIFYVPFTAGYCAAHEGENISKSMTRLSPIRGTARKGLLFSPVAENFAVFERYDPGSFVHQQLIVRY
jgi:hypothetical protein